MNARHAHTFGDEDQRQLAVMMSMHPRLGQDSLQLRDQTAEVVTMIAQMGLTPIVERPIRLLVGFNPDRVGPDDDFVDSWPDEATALTDPRTPFLCTVLDRGVPVFRAPLRHADVDFGSLSYYSRRRYGDGARVSFNFVQTPEPPPQFPIDAIIERQFVDRHNNNNAEESGCFTNRTDVYTPAELLAFRARNTLGIELRITAAAALPMTPILPPSAEY